MLIVFLSFWRLWVHVDGLDAVSSDTQRDDNLACREYITTLLYTFQGDRDQVEQACRGAVSSLRLYALSVYHFLMGVELGASGDNDLLAYQSMVEARRMLVHTLSHASLTTTVVWSPAQYQQLVSLHTLIDELRDFYAHRYLSRLFASLLMRVDTILDRFVVILDVAIATRDRLRVWRSELVDDDNTSQADELLLCVEMLEDQLGAYRDRVVVWQSLVDNVQARLMTLQQACGDSPRSCLDQSASLLEPLDAFLLTLEDEVTHHADALLLLQEVVTQRDIAGVLDLCAAGGVDGMRGDALTADDDDMDPTWQDEIWSPHALDRLDDLVRDLDDLLSRDSWAYDSVPLPDTTPMELSDMPVEFERSLQSIRAQQQIYHQEKIQIRTQPTYDPLRFIDEYFQYFFGDLDEFTY